LIVQSGGWQLLACHKSTGNAGLFLGFLLS
jgi:hypothetical protein